MLNPIADRIENYLSTLTVRQRVTASNIANADTPGYKTKDVDFQSELNGAVDGSTPIVEVQGLKVKNDGNNVSLDREARNLAENALRFQVATNFLQAQIRGVRAAIQEGRG